MVKKVILDKIIVQGTEYETTDRTALVINKVGTNSAGDGYLFIDEKKTGTIKELVAPLHKTSSNLLGPLCLGDLFYVVPPQTKFEWIGDSGSKARIIGIKFILDPREVLPGEYMTRFETQFKHWISYVEGTVSLGTDEVWAADRELTVYNITPLTPEKYIFNSVLMAAISGDTIVEGQVSLLFYYDGNPLETYVSKNLWVGFDILSARRPPADTTEILPFTLAEFPITVPGDVNFQIRAKNVSGAGLTPATGAKWTVTATTIIEYIKRV